MSKENFQKIYNEINNRPKLIVLDNDECQGQFSVLGDLHTLFGVDSDLKYPKNKVSMDKFKDIIVEKYIKKGGARPHLKSFLKHLHNLKEKKKIEGVYMYTAASNDNDWVVFLKDTLENFSKCPNLYDKVYSRQDCNKQYKKDLMKLAHKGGAKKNGLPNIKKEYLTSNMIMFDDNPHRINSRKGNVFGVKAYNTLPSWTNIKSIVNDCGGEEYLNSLYNLNKKTFIDYGVQNGNILNWLKRNYNDYKEEYNEKMAGKDKELIVAKHIIDAQIKL